jgi:hypothetical protein
MGTIKLLTGKTLHEAFNYTSMWGSLPDHIKARYNEIAKTLNEKLGLCANCGKRPQDGLQLQAGNMICSACVNPPLQGGEQTQWIWAMFNDNGQISGVVELPDGMTYEEYSKQLKEEMSRYRFILSYETFEGKPEFATARLLSELNDQINKFVPIATPDRKHAYSIQVFKDAKRVGYGAYYRTWDGIEIVEEMDQAKGLNDLLNYEYAFKHAEEAQC